jgi:phospholipid/cholesterol/gamma-HCH transport system substrate-binding protein
MYSRINYTLVGVSVFIFSLLMIAFAFWLAKDGLSKEFDHYQIYVEESVAGIGVDSAVKLMGVDVGKVAKLSIEEENVESVKVLLKLDRGTPIKEDMRAVIKFYGMTGLAYIEIEGGSNRSALLKKGEEIPTIQTSRSYITRLDETLSSLSSKLTLLLDSLSKLLNEENLHNVNAILANINTLTQKGEQVEDQMLATLESAKSALGEVKPLVRKFNMLSGDLKSLTKKLERSLDSGHYDIKGAIEPIKIDINEIAGEMTELLRSLREDPSGMLFGSPAPKRGPGE